MTVVKELVHICSLDPLQIHQTSSFLTLTLGMTLKHAKK